MSPTFHRRLLLSPAIDLDDARALVTLARTLKRGGSGPGRLRGMNIALLSPHAAGEGARRFDAAASALGARVAHVEPAPAWLDASAPIGAQAARLFESLYDAVDCEEVPPGFAQRLQEQLALPVYDGLASDRHPIFDLLPAVAEDSGAPGDEDRRALLQAALVGALT